MPRGAGQETPRETADRERLRHGAGLVEEQGTCQPTQRHVAAVDRGQRIAHRGAVRRDGAGVTVERRDGEGVDGHRGGVVRLGRLPGGPGAVRFLVAPGEGERVAADGVVDHGRRGVHPLREESRVLLLLRLGGEQVGESLVAQGVAADQWRGQPGAAEGEQQVPRVVLLQAEHDDAGIGIGGQRIDDGANRRLAMVAVELPGLLDRAGRGERRRERRGQRLLVRTGRGDDGGGVVAQDVTDVGRQEAAFEAVGEDRPEGPGIVLRQRIGRGGAADGRDAGRAIDLAGRDGGRRGAVTQHQERPRVGDDRPGHVPGDIGFPWSS